ncbi:hypothetical protein DPMN_149591 [Dreissena polymorpha]|uniref:Uncharacterized protein n=1 Tax=Dreissena polymorpha TaxID=45954 RepID=A0A9D4J5G3_DREPO|nr:hypothetical protein DPMN_149591 [Dreissena polymorpha]
MWSPCSAVSPTVPPTSCAFWMPSMGGGVALRLPVTVLRCEAGCGNRSFTCSCPL